jgi:hypothetical protein
VPFAVLAKQEGVSPSYFTWPYRLSYLAPDITQAILDGRQPPSRLPLAWHDHRTVLGLLEKISALIRPANRLTAP